MSKPYLIKEHQEVEFIADSDMYSGDVKTFGTQAIGIVVRDVKEGGVGLAYMEGVYCVPVSVGIEVSAGGPVYWDASNSVFTSIAESNIFAGSALKDITDTDTSAVIALGKYYPAQVTPEP